MCQVLNMKLFHCLLSLPQKMKIIKDEFAGSVCDGGRRIPCTVAKLSVRCAAFRGAYSSICQSVPHLLIQTESFFYDMP